VCKKDSFPLVKAYGDVREGQHCALFASNGNLQLAVNRGKAASLQGIAVDNEVLLIIGEE
jgi:S-adenosylmethionine hydrolase